MNPADGAMHTLEELRAMASTLPIGTTSHMLDGAEMMPLLRYLEEEKVSA